MVGRNSFTYVALLIILVACVITPTAFYVRNLMEVNLKGVIDVKPSTKIIDVEFNVDSEEGERSVSLGSLYIPSGNVVVRGKLTSYEGNFTLILSGELLLRSGTHSYKILMPCLASIGGHCYRIMMLIPGYDAPLTVTEGDYNATLTLRWSAGGVGKFSLKLVLEFSESVSNTASISVIGVKPGSTDGWIVAENSTRSYSMLASRVSPTSTLVWVWIFDPHNVSDYLLTLEVVDVASGDAVSESIVNMFRDGVYWSVLVEVNASTLDRYLIRATFKDVVMGVIID